ncbi:MAG: DUF4954 family protein [Lentisphaerae bacterium]|nr:DUF4954 family protein [Lentisphaerota bacterium]
MGKTKFEPIAQSDIEILKKNRCLSSDWSKVVVADGFDASRVSLSVFEGDVAIGSLSGDVLMPEGSRCNAMIRNANLKNVSIGDNCVICNVNGWLTNLDIADDVVIENVGTVACVGETCFGNGHEITVQNEGGGREIKITAETSAQIAYMMAFYRNKPELIAKLNNMADAYAETAKRVRAFIAKGARILNCSEIINVFVGEAAIINGVQSLRNGTIVSSLKAPTTVGSGVIAHDFIIQQGASVKDGAMVCASLVGEATKIGKQFSAENSVFFANSEGFHSEVCSVFAGPYTVTHHRSTLLIAGLFSFYNAGSGTNQSNHMYKLGPLHQGILERGCKTGSFSYLLWPSRIGAFTAVIGKHYANFDTSDLPFSYITEEHGKTTIVPAMNFFTVGTMRDGEKWPARDRRKNGRKLDQINFEVLSPYTAQKMIRGRQILARLLEESEKGQEYVIYRGIHIKRLLLKTCSRYYKLALDKYFGDVLMTKLEKNPDADALALMKASGTDDEWLDVCGLICPRNSVNALVDSIVAGKVKSFSEMYDAFSAIHAAYADNEWSWFLANYVKVTGRNASSENLDGLKEFINAWKASSLKLLNMVKSDAEKEFDETVKTGFGIDGDKDADFVAVRGEFESNKFVNKLDRDAEVVEKRYVDIMKRIA